MMKTAFLLAGVLLLLIMISCNEIDELPLPTLVPTIEVPETVLTVQVAESTQTPSSPVETPVSGSDSTESESEFSFIGTGNIIYFSIAGEGLFFVNSDLSEPVQRHDLHNISRFLARSPDGEWLALMNGGKLYSAKTDGSTINEIIDISNISWVSWSPDGDRFAFIQNGNIFTMNADDMNIQRLTDGLELMDGSTTLSWSPDSSRLLFTCDLEASDICLVNSRGDEAVVNLTNNTEPAWYREPSWSPDGTLISFVSLGQEDNLHIFTMNADGSNIVKLTDAGENSLHVWSPDGTRIAYASTVNDKWQAIVMNRDGSEKFIVSENLPSETNSIYPSWSPSGNRIGLYYTVASNPDEFAILIRDMNSSEQTSLTEHAKWADWSPDGTQIAFLSSDSQIHIVNSDGAGAVNIINCSGGCENFAWLP